MQIIYGINPVIETLSGDRGSIERIVLARGRRERGVDKILKLAERKKIPIDYRERQYLNNLAGSASHQGVICIGKKFTYAAVDEIIGNRHEAFENSFVLILDHIEDPQNLGSIIRSAHCFGINGIIIPEKRAASITPTVIKVSAGAAQHIPISRVINISRTIDYLKDRGFWIYGTDAAADTEVLHTDLTGNIAFIMGSEGKGIRPLVKKKCDFLLSIPMFGSVDSLNVSVATGIILYEVTQRRKNIS